MSEKGRRALGVSGIGPFWREDAREASAAKWGAYFRYAGALLARPDNRSGRVLAGLAIAAAAEARQIREVDLQLLALHLAKVGPLLLGEDG